MLAGVEILLERMKTNPEEFIEGGFSKWSRVIDSAWSILTEEEQIALKAGVDNAKREHFNGEVMRVLAGQEDEGESYGTSYATNLSKSAILTTSTLKQQIQDTLSKQFDKAYAKREGDQVAWWDGRLPRDIYKDKE